MAQKLRRVDVEGGWIDLRTKITLGDLEVIETRKSAREPNETLDAIDLIERLVQGWSFQVEVSPESIREEIDSEMISAITEAIQEIFSPPNGSTPSLNGGGAGTEASTSSG